MGFLCFIWILQPVKFISLMSRVYHKVGWKREFPWEKTPDHPQAELGLSHMWSKKISNDQELIQSDPTTCPELGSSIMWVTYLGSWLTTCLGKSCSFGLQCVPFVKCCQCMFLVISLLVLRAGYGIWLYQFLIIAYLFTSNPQQWDGEWFRVLTIRGLNHTATGAAENGL